MGQYFLYLFLKVYLASRLLDFHAEVVVVAVHRLILLRYNQLKHSSKYINMSMTYQARTCTYGSPVNVCTQSKYKYYSVQILQKG